MELSLRTVLVSVLTGVISAVLLLIIALVPLINITVLLFPVPFIVVGVKKGIWAGILSLLISVVIIGTLTHPLLIIVLAGIFLLLVVALIHSFRNEYDFYENILISSGSTIAAILISTRIYALAAGKSIFDYLWDSIRRFFETSSFINLKMLMDYNRQFSDSFGNITTEKQLIEFIISRLQILVPSSLILFSLVYGTLIFLISRTILKHLNTKVTIVPPLELWRLPRGMVFGFLLILFAASLGSLINNEIFEAVNIAATALISFIFTVQGIAVVWFFFKEWNLPPLASWIFIILIYVVFHVFITFNMGLTILGLLEQLFGFRAMYKNRRIKAG